MKMDIMKVRAITQKLHLDVPRMYEYALLCYPSIADQVANGVGSETSAFYHLTPDTVWGLNINPSSHGHDWDYTFPFKFVTYAEGMKHFHAANERFRINCLKLVEDGSWLLKPFRRHRVEFYFKILEAEGELAFWSNKILPPDVPNAIKSTIDLDEKVIARYQEIQDFLTKNMLSQGVPA